MAEIQHMCVIHKDAHCKQIVPVIDAGAHACKGGRSHKLYAIPFLAGQKHSWLMFKSMQLIGLDTDQLLFRSQIMLNEASVSLWACDVLIESQMYTGMT